MSDIRIGDANGTSAIGIDGGAMARVSDEGSTFDGQCGMTDMNGTAKNGVVTNEINIFKRYFCAAGYVHRGANLGT